MVAGFILPTAALDQTRRNFGGLKHLKLLLLDFDVSHSLVYQGASNVGSSAESLFRGFLATVLYRACSSAGVKKSSAGVSITEVYAIAGGETDTLSICTDLIRGENNLVRFL